MNLILIALRKTAVTPVLMHWSYRSLALSYPYVLYSLIQNSFLYVFGEIKCVSILTINGACLPDLDLS